MGGRDTQILLAVQKIFELYALSGGGDAKNWTLSLAPITSHLVKRSLPNILNFCAVVLCL